MNKQIELTDISWNVSEADYRKDPALSYSTLARFKREGFNNLDKLFKTIESPSLTLGSVVDSLITGGESEFNSRFMVADIPSLEPSIEPIVKAVFSICRDSYTNINDIPDSQIMPIIAQYNYQPRWKPETRIKKVKADGAQFYQTMFIAKDKQILTQDTYNTAFAMVRALKDSPNTHDFFCDNNPFDSKKRYYQLKFKTTLDNIDYRCMADLIIVNYESKTIIPVDLKTSGKPEWDFYKSFIDFDYQIQARLYWRIIRDTLDKDEYFKDFKLMDYKFIVVCKDTLTPLIWNFEDTQATGELSYQDGKIKCPDPVTLGRELYSYLTEKPKVPMGITEDSYNSITTWLNYGK
jgi:hypothetical protein